MHRVVAEQPEDDAVEVLLARLRFVRRLRTMLDAELDVEEHALLSLLRQSGVSWRRLGEEEYGVSLNAVAQRYSRLDERVRNGGLRGGEADRR